ncbi:MAG: FIST N-terminal domain-containing protein [Candidatus Omnitrophota bacterium]|jgi:small ligand-binding sensory domain FIST
MLCSGTGFSKNRNAEAAAREASAQALEKAGQTASRAALVFASYEHRDHYPEILREVRRVTQAEHVIGSSAYGVMTESSELENRHAVAVMAVHCDDDAFASLMASDLQESNFRAGEKAAKTLAHSGFHPSSLVLLADPFSFQSHHFFEGLESVLGYLPITGGLSSENGRDGKTFQMAGGRLAFDSAALLALGETLRAETAMARSCQPFGDPVQITKAEGNLIYEMDGRPAYDMLLESISQTPIESTDHLTQRVFLGIPVRSFQTDFVNSPYLIRNLMGINEKKGLLTCVSPVPEGEFVTFACQDPEFARQSLKEVLDDMRERILPGKPAFGLYFNSCARGSRLYGQRQVDIRMIRDAFPDTPILGFFGYGEIAPVDFVNHLHHYSGVLTLVS